MLKVVPIAKPNRPHERANDTENFAVSKQEHAHNPSFGVNPQKSENFIIKGYNNLLDKIVGILPNKVVEKDKQIAKIKKMGGWTTPQNRFFMGITALAIQPWIDLNNKDTDDDTRKISACRTTAKIIAGTLTGVLIRFGCIELIKSCTQTDPKELEKIKSPFIKNIATSLIPSNMSPEQFGKIQRLVKNHRNAIGSIIALGVMLFTNFALDVPITKFLTNVFKNKFVNNNQVNPEEKGGN